jgi:hypothetical protein
MDRALVRLLAHSKTPIFGGSVTTSQLDRSDFQSITGSHEGAFRAEPAAGGHPRGGWGGQGSRWLGTVHPTHPVMPDLIVLWKMGPLRGEGRAGARLWLREATRRARGGTGPESKPGAAGDTSGPLRGKARRPAGGYFLAKTVSALGSLSGPV